MYANSAPLPFERRAGFLMAFFSAAFSALAASPYHLLGVLDGRVIHGQNLAGF